MEAALAIVNCITSVLFWLMLPMGMYVVCKLFQEQRANDAIATLLLFCCCGIGHIMAVNALHEHGERWGTNTLGWLYPLLLYAFGIGFVVQIVLGLIHVRSFISLTP